MIAELVRLLLIPLLKEEGGVLKPPRPKPKLDSDEVHFYEVEGVDGDVLMEVPGVGMFFAPESVMDELRGAPPPERRRRKTRVYMLARELTSDELRKVFEQVAGGGG